MADSDPNKPGTQTSEFKFATVLSVVGVLLTGMATVFSALKEQFPNVTWVGSIAGALVAIAPAVAYIVNRGMVKSSQIKADAHVDAASIAMGISPSVAVGAGTVVKPANP